MTSGEETPNIYPENQLQFLLHSTEGLHCWLLNVWTFSEA